MKLTRSKRRSMEDLYEASMSRIVDHLDSDDIATLTSFITQGDWNRRKNKQALSKAENDRRNRKLSKDLQYLGYSFIRVDGEYTQKGHDEPISETSFFVIKPVSYTLKAFRMDMINLAHRYEQESVIIWDHESKKAILYATDNYKNYKPDLTFSGFSVDKARELAWMSFNKNWFMFEESRSTKSQRSKRLKEKMNRYHFTVSSVVEGLGDGGDDTPVYRFVCRRKRMFNEQYW